jgi:hypothetical protein
MIPTTAVQLQATQELKCTLDTYRQTHYKKYYFQYTNILIYETQK